MWIRAKGLCCKRTQQMCRDGPFQVDAFRAVLFVQSPANIRVYVVIERLQFLP